MDDSLTCPINRLDCGFGTYDPKAGPPRDDCELCWRRYNVVHDLPNGNRVPRSKWTAKSYEFNAYVTNRLPRIEPLFDEKPDNFKKALSDEMLASEVYQLGDNRTFEPLVMALDVSSRGTGIVVVGRQHRDEAPTRYVAASHTFGLSLNADDGIDLRTNRQYQTIRVVMGVYDAIDGKKHEVPVWIEDYAYSAKGAHVHQVFELTGQIKMQLYLSTGRCIQPVGISTARSEVFNNGAAKKPDLLDAMVREGYSWAKSMTDDEVDALAVAGVYMKQNHARQVDDIIRSITEEEANG